MVCKQVHKVALITKVSSCHVLAGCPPQVTITAIVAAAHYELRRQGSVAPASSNVMAPHLKGDAQACAVAHDIELEPEQVEDGATRVLPAR